MYVTALMKVYVLLTFIEGENFVMKTIKWNCL